MAGGGGTMRCKARKFIFTVFLSLLILTAFAIRSSAPTPTLTEECKKYIAKYLGESPEPNKYCFTDTTATTVQYWTVIDEEQWGSTLDAVVTIVIFEGYSYEDKVNKTGKIDAEKLKEKNGGTALTEDDLDWIRTHSNGKDKFCYTEVATPTFDTGRSENPYPSISGKFIGTIKTNTKIIAKKLYTYACEGTGGHTEHALICNSTWCAEAKWEGYKGDWMNISFNRTVILMPYETYNDSDRLLSSDSPHSFSQNRKWMDKLH